MGALFATSHAARFVPCASVLNDAGVNVERALTRARFPSKILYEPDLVVPSRSLYLFAARMARKEGLENLAFLAAKREGFSKLEEWVRSCLLGAATLGEMLQRYCAIANNYNTYHHYDLQTDARLARVCCALPADAKMESWLRYSDWSNAALFRETIRYVLGENYEPTAITFQTKGEIYPESENDLGKTRLLQGWRTTSVVFPKHLLATPLPDCSPSKCDLDRCIPDKFVDQSFPTVMRSLLKPCLTQNWLDIEAAAELSGSSSVRTFQRRLSKSGLTYKKLLEQTRMEVARSLLAEQHESILNIGYEVGYTDPSHFTRAFRRAHGVTPREYRLAA